MQARIYRPAKNAMQSGRANTKRWLLEFEAESARHIEPLMGWTSSADMNGQVRIFFDDKDAAINFAKKHGLAHQVMEPKERTPKRKAYADNFSADRITSWTH